MRSAARAAAIRRLPDVKRWALSILNVERQQGASRRLVLNRPDVRNAFNEGMIAS